MRYAPLQKKAPSTYPRVSAPGPRAMVKALALRAPSFWRAQPDGGEPARDPLDRVRRPAEPARDPLDRVRDPLDRVRDPLDCKRGPLDRVRRPIQRARA